MMINDLGLQASLLLLQQAQATNSYAHLLLIAGIFIIMYFFMLRPQMKKAKEQQAFIDNIQKGDKVVTVGGIHAKIAKVNDSTFLIEVDNNVRLKIEKSFVSPENTESIQPS